MWNELSSIDWYINYKNNWIFTRKRHLKKHGLFSKNIAIFIIFATFEYNYLFYKNKNV